MADQTLDVSPVAAPREGPSEGQGEPYDRSHRDVDRLAPVRFRVGAPRGRVLEYGFDRPRRFRLGHGRPPLGPTGDLRPAVGQGSRRGFAFNFLLSRSQSHNSLHQYSQMCNLKNFNLNTIFL